MAKDKEEIANVIPYMEAAPFPAPSEPAPIVETEISIDEEDTED